MKPDANETEQAARVKGRILEYTAAVFQYWRLLELVVRPTLCPRA